MSGLPQMMPDTLRHDWLNLSALITETAHRQVVPCFNGNTQQRAHWTSDSAAECTSAARECGACPVVIQCRQYGVDHPKETGVYGGLTEKERRESAT